MIAAIDIGGTKIAAALYSDGQCIERRGCPTPRDDPQALVDAAAALMDGWRYTAIGVAVTGYVVGGKVYAINRETLAGWHDFPLAIALRDRLQFEGRVLLQNDAAAAAWAEYKARSSKTDRMAFVTVSTGVGGGLVLDGKLVQSPGGIAGHIGHMKIADHGLCGCGRTGCVEAIASGRAIAKSASEQFGYSVTAREVFARLDTDRSCQAIVEASAWAVAELFGNLRMALDLDLLVIGGSVGLADGYIDRVRRQSSTLPELAQGKIEPAIHTKEAGLMGVYLQLAAS